VYYEATAEQYRRPNCLTAKYASIDMDHFTDDVIALVKNTWMLEKGRPITIIFCFSV